MRMRFRRAPLLAAAVAFALGIAASHTVPRPVPLLFAGLSLLLILALVASRWASRVAVWPILGVWTVLGMAAGVWHPGAPQPLRLLGLSDGLSRTVRGRVERIRVPALAAETPQSDADAVPPWEAAEDTSAERGRPASLDLAVEQAEDVTPDTSTMVPVEGGVRISVYGGLPALNCGDRLELPLRLRTPARFQDPGVFQAADYLLTQGIAAQASVAGDKITRLSAGSSSWTCRLQAAQAWASGRMIAFAQSPENLRMPSVMRLTLEDAQMLNAMLFGDRTGLNHKLRAGFERTGTFHLFVVSGLHLALLAGAVFWAMRRLRSPAWLATAVTLGASTIYAALTGFGQPVQRALAMTAVFLVARLLSRDRDSLNALGAAALALLVWAPASLFEASFQMTVLAVLAIAGIAIPLGERTFLGFARVARFVFIRYVGYMTPTERQLRFTLELWGHALAEVLGSWSRRLPARALQAAVWGLELALIGVVAELVMVLPMAVYFHRAAVFALPANMLVIPLLGLLAPSAVLTFLAALVHPWAALVPGAATALLLHGVRAGIWHVGRLGAANLRVPGPVWWVGLLAVAGWFACCWAVRRSGWTAALAALALPAIAAMVLWPEPVVRTPGALEVTALDVGQGDSLLAISPEGQTMLIDAGGPVGSHGVSEIVSNFDIGEEVVSPYLWSRRLRRLDVLVLTHAHTDHMGGMPAVLESFRPRELWVSINSASPLYQALLRKAAELGIPVRHLHAGDQARLGSVAIAVLAPTPAYQNPGSPRNDDSLVLTMHLGKASVLLAGDAERPSEDAMVASGSLQPVTLLKVGHHGSRTSSNPEFLAAVHPQDAVVSVGLRNTFGHPRSEVITRFAAAGTHLFRTDEFGLTSFLLTPDGSIRESVHGVMLPRGPSQP